MIHAATPATVAAALVAAQPGDVIKLASGVYPRLVAKTARDLAGVVLDAEGATIDGQLWFTRYSGFALRGGLIRSGVRLDVGTVDVTVEGIETDGDGSATSYGVHVPSGARNVRVLDCVFRGHKSGVALNRVDGFEIAGGRFCQMRNDGMTIGESRNGRIAWNDFADTRPVTAAEHPDAIQLFSRPTSAPTADIAIEKNRVRGLNSQGIVGFDHVRAGVSDGGFDRITIQDNDVCVGFPHAIALANARDSIVRRNKVSTFPGAKHRASINITAGSVERTGNTVAAHGKTKGDDDPAPGDALAAQVADLTAKLDAVRAVLA